MYKDVLLFVGVMQLYIYKQHQYQQNIHVNMLLKNYYNELILDRNIQLFLNMFYYNNILDNNHQIKFFVIHEINDIQHVLDVHDNRK